MLEVGIEPETTLSLHSFTPPPQSPSQSYSSSINLKPKCTIAEFFQFFIMNAPQSYELCM